MHPRAVGKLSGGVSGMSKGVGELTLHGLLDAVGARTVTSPSSPDGLTSCGPELFRWRSPTWPSSPTTTGPTGGHDGDVEVIAALDETIRVPLEMAEVAAELAGGLAGTGNPNLRGDATAAVLMGAAAARAGAVLVCENLVGAGRDPRRARRGPGRISQRRRAGRSLALPGSRNSMINARRRAGACGGA